ncbi:oxygenase MpaB family protein [Spirosoma flavum]|uniref:Oxygenase MpaB family protein n=1 Tax=Spirosoma flavum TaxID=2048557 RepID=A0ABW6AJS1_9BACT
MPTLIKPSRPFPDALLERYRQQGDSPADAVVAAVVDVDASNGLRALMRWLADTNDLSTTNQHPAVQAFFTNYASLPSWADPARMKRGMVFFQKHAQQIGLTLGFFSLPYSYLGANGAQVLWLTERIKNDTSRRLQETGEWVFAVNNPKEWTTGNAITRTQKIRLIHAGARWFALHSGRWNMAWGYPVNQEDMAGTSLAFSYIVLLGLRKSGVTATEQEEEDYLHHINVVGHLNGVTDELIPKNLREAYNLGHAIARRQFAPSEAGVGLTRSLLNAIASGIASTQSAQTSSDQSGSKRQAVQSETIRNLAAGEMRFFMGDQYADWLGIPNAPVEKRLAGLLSRLPIFSQRISQ